MGTARRQRPRVNDPAAFPPPCTWRRWWTPPRRPRPRRAPVPWTAAGMWHPRRALWHGGRCTWRRPLWRTCSLSTRAWVCMDRRRACGALHWLPRLPHHPALPPCRQTGPCRGPGRPPWLPESVGWSSWGPASAARCSASSGSWGPAASWSGRTAQFSQATATPSAATALPLAAPGPTTTASANPNTLARDGNRWLDPPRDARPPTGSESVLHWHSAVLLCCGVALALSGGELVYAHGGRICKVKRGGSICSTAYRCSFCSLHPWPLYVGSG